MSRIVLVTGMSGAGRTTALKVLEDLGFEAVDNLPATLLANLVRPGDRFLDCDDEILQRRFTETRRRHPLEPDRPVTDGILRERRLIAPLRERADLVIDTSQLSPARLRQLIAGHFGVAKGARPTLSVISFAYRNGLPREADLVFDVRFLANPHYVDELRPLTGLTEGVRSYVEGDPAYALLMERLEDLILPLLPFYQREGKSYLTLAFGCTGGRHRSIVVAESFAERLRNSGWLVSPPAQERHSMIGLILVTHGRLAEEFIAATEHVVGSQTHMRAISIGPDDDIEQRRRDILAAVEAVDSGAGVILLTDMFGGTPSNLAISIMDKGKIEVIAGVNLPMLIKLASVRDSEALEDAVASAQEAGRKYINVASTLLKVGKGPARK
ncbi:MAG: glmZ(sRNA)-inactivating NTPase [Geminicoccaceae bacterium]|nr:glmZ(sRNA)-inactivating NTPase [Geminicoccaceae bacterium]